MSATGVENGVSQKNILDLNVDCCEELFEWLILSDLKALRQTCKRLKTIVDHHIQLAYPKGRLTILDQDGSKDLRKFDSSFGKLCKDIYFILPIPDEVIECMKPILNSVERVSIFVNQMAADFHNDFVQLHLPMCTNVKYLHVAYLNNDEWLLYNFPSLEHLHLTAFFAGSSPELRSFFELNPNVRRFSTDAQFALDNENWMTESNVHLDELGIQCFDGDVPDICRLLNILFRRGLYKRLKLYFCDGFDQGHFDLIASLNGLDTLHLKDNCVKDFAKTPMPQVKEFCLHNTSGVHDGLVRLVESFTNIERINCGYASFKSILPFIHRSIKLKKIKIQTPEDDGTYCYEGIIELPALNRERSRYAGASKVTIYVGEYFYLQTKAAFMTTEFTLVELKRAESFIWELDF